MGALCATSLAPATLCVFLIFRVWVWLKVRQLPPSFLLGYGALPSGRRCHCYPCPAVFDCALVLQVQRAAWEARQSHHPQQHISTANRRLCRLCYDPVPFLPWHCSDGPSHFHSHPTLSLPASTVDSPRNLTAPGTPYPC